MLCADYREFRGYPPKSWLHIIWLACLEPGFRAVALFRAQDSMYRSGRPSLAMALMNLNQVLTGAEIRSGARIGPGLVMRHPSGVVIGIGTVVGARCTILQQVTLGERRIRDADGRYPVIGDDVVLAAGAKVLGPVRVGHRSLVGANAVVIEDVLEDSVAAAPAARSRPRRAGSRAPL